MRMVDIIEKKRDGGKLTKEEIEFFVTDMLMERFLIIRLLHFLWLYISDIWIMMKLLILLLRWKAAGISSICLLLMVLK